eukprot:scaffold21935_cov62-Phaeocystis_antarctica.AAC.2
MAGHGEHNAWPPSAARLLLRIHLEASLHFLLELYDRLLALLERADLLLQRAEALLFRRLLLHLSIALIASRLAVLDHRHLTQGKRGSAALRRLQGVQGKWHARHPPPLPPLPQGRSAFPALGHACREQVGQSSE